MTMLFLASVGLSMRVNRFHVFDGGICAGNYVVGVRQAQVFFAPAA
jgi:hypothetical protein